MTTIWKFQLETIDAQAIDVPDGAEFLCVQIQHGKPCIWALVDSEKSARRRYLLTIGTGNPIPGGLGRYLGSYQLDGGSLVFHIFEGGDIRPADTPEARFDEWVRTKNLPPQELRDADLKWEKSRPLPRYPHGGPAVRALTEDRCDGPGKTNGCTGCRKCDQRYR